MLSKNRSLVLATLTGLTLLALTAPVFAHGSESQDEPGSAPGGVPFGQQAPGQMLGGGMMGGGMMGGGMMGGQKGFGGMMGITPPATVPPCPGVGASPSAPCGNQGPGGMTAPRGQMLPMTR